MYVEYPRKMRLVSLTVHLIYLCSFDIIKKIYQAKAILLTIFLAGHSDRKYSFFN